jgi:hypothetical protein
MKVKKQGTNDACCSREDNAVDAKPFKTLLPIQNDVDQGEACCGPPAGPPSSPLERPGYTLCSFVEGFVQTSAGPVPKVKDYLERQDHLGTLKVRTGIGRNNYKIAPGLYCVGSPTPEAPVLVTANYKLSFDVLRKEIKEMGAWILVLDTRGINVWCAAGKKTFSTDEVVRQVRQSDLTRIVNHRRLIIPQLGATGVSAQKVKKQCGFEVTWGPVRANDIKTFINAGFKADSAMRRVTFTLWERMVLVPVELTLLQKYLVWVLPMIFVISGVGANIFSFQQAWHRGLMLIAALAAGVFSGAVVVPILLPWLPGKAFSLKGSIPGIVLGTVVAGGVLNRFQMLDATALILLTTALSSYLAMNFTGTTPYTSPSGVEKEMRIAIPGQAGAVVVSLVLWLGSSFI